MPIVSVAMPTIGGSAGRLTTDRPNTTPEAAIAESRKPAVSIGRAPAGAMSGSTRVASQMPASPIGTLIRKIQCQVKKVVMKPPTGGPTSGPTSAGTVSQAIAETSSRFGVARTSTRRATGVIMAPPSPCAKRASTKASSEPDNAQAIEPRMKTPIAARKMRLAP